MHMDTTFTLCTLENTQDYEVQALVWGRSESPPPGSSVLAHGSRAAAVTPCILKPAWDFSPSFPSCVQGSPHARTPRQDLPKCSDKEPGFVALALGHLCADCH